MDGAAGIPPNAKFNVRFATLDHGTSVKVNHEHVLPREWIIDRLLESGKSWREKDLGRFWRKTASPALSPSRSTRGLSTLPKHIQGWNLYRQAGLIVRDLTGDGFVDLGPWPPPDGRGRCRTQMDQPCVELEPGRGAHGGTSG